MDTEVAGNVAMWVGSGLGVIDSLAAGKLLGATVGKKIKKDAVDKIIKELLAKPSKQVGRAALKGMATEGITETIQSGIQEATAATLTGNLDLKRRTLSALEEGLAGTMMGGVIGGGRRAGILTRDWIKEKRPQADPSPEPTPPVAPAPEGTPEVVPETVGETEIEGATGSETTLRTPNSEHPSHYRIVEAGNLQPSHNAFTFEKNPVYPEGVQERTYHTSKDAQNKVIQDSQKLAPDMVVNTTPTAIDGPPQVTPKGVVLGGNGRTMAIQRAYQDGEAEGYRKYLMKHARDFGISGGSDQGHETTRPYQGGR